MSKVKEHGMIFSGPMVRALLDETKTQTRRIVKPQPNLNESFSHRYPPNGPRESYGHSCWYPSPIHPKARHYGSTAHFLKGMPIDFAPIKPGDRIWVRESFQPLLAEDTRWSDADYKTGEGYAVNYVATGGVVEFYDYSKDESFSDRITPSIYMPRWASRITLEITDVRVQRVGEISRADACAEGIHVLPLQSPDDPGAWWESSPGNHQARTAVGSFGLLWESLHGSDAWERNDWVWCYTFRRIAQERPACE